MKSSLYVILCCLTLVGCTTPQNATPPSREPTVVTPSVAPAASAHCQQAKVSATCQEWTPLQPQPSFADMVRLLDTSKAHNDMSWGGLYLCGVFSPEWLVDFLGEGYHMVILNRFICGIYSRDSSSSLNVHVGDGSLDEFADFHLPGAPAKERTEISGRDAVRYKRSESQYSASHDYILGIPNVDDHVLIVGIRFGATFGVDKRTVLPDLDVAKLFSDETAAILIAISEPSR